MVGYVGDIETNTDTPACWSVSSACQRVISVVISCDNGELVAIPVMRCTVGVDAKEERAALGEWFACGTVSIAQVCSSLSGFQSMDSELSDGLSFDAVMLSAENQYCTSNSQQPLEYDDCEVSLCPPMFLNHGRIDDVVAVVGLNEFVST